MSNRLDDKSLDLLYKSVLALESYEDCKSFFEDLCTIPELKALSQRLTVAKMLHDKCVYSEIVANTGASTATISRVNRSLMYGNNGYEKVFEKLNGKDG